MLKQNTKNSYKATDFAVDRLIMGVSDQQRETQAKSTVRRHLQYLNNH